MEYGYGGMGNVAFNVVKKINEKGVECTICSPVGPDIKLGSKSMIRKYGILGILQYWHKVGRYFAQRVEDYDLVWLHDPLFIRNNPFQRGLITMHGTYYLFSIFAQSALPLYKKLYYKMTAKIEKYCLNKINLEKKTITCVSRHVCKGIEEMGVESKRPIIYVPNGVNIDKIMPTSNKKSLRNKFNIRENDIVILSLCRLTRHKRPYDMIDVFSLIEKEIKNATLVMAGLGELFSQSKKFAHKKNVKNIMFLGYVDEVDKPDLYACSDYFITASEYEGGEPNLAVAEAMASGLPCIVSDIPGLRIVEDAKCGINVDFNDIEKAAKKIVGYLVKNNSEHSKNAREYAIKNLDWTGIAERYFEEFEKVMSDNR